MKEELKKTETIEATETQSEKPYVFRRLTTQDIFPTLKLLNKIGFKDIKIANKTIFINGKKVIR